MRVVELENDLVHVGVTKQCGHLFPVRFNLNGKIIEPLHVSPWYNDSLDDSVPPMLKMLRGDFFCAPFGDSDLLEDESRPHGATSNDEWELLSKEDYDFTMYLKKRVMGADVIKKIKLIPGHPVVYQDHIFIGGNGSIPVGHHLMIKAPEKMYLSFSKYLFGETPPSAVESDPEKGNSILLYPQRFTDLKRVKLLDWKEADFSRYPAYTEHEDLLMLRSDESLQFAWSAVSAPRNGWLWFALKNPRMLKSTILWFSNGGRKYPPFSGRHLNVIGVEEVTSFFHLGHKASTESNHLNKEGFATSITLSSDEALSARYAFGLTPIPADFTYVKNISPAEGGIMIEDVSGKRINVNFDLDFITEKQESK